MDLISELVFILSQSKPKTLDSVLPPDTKSRILFDEVSKGRIHTDNQAANFIYKSDKKDKRFLKLKRNLHQKLFQLVLVADYKGLNIENYIKIKFNLQNDLIIAERLLLSNVYHNAEKILQKVLQEAEKYFLIEVQHDCARKLRTMYALKGFPSETIKYDAYTKQFETYRQYYDASKAMLEIVKSKIKFPASKSEEVANDIKTNIDIIKNWYKMYESPFLRLTQLRLELIFYDQLCEEEIIKEVLIEISRHCSIHQFIVTKELKLEILLAYARHYRNLGNLKMSKQYINESIKISDYRAFNRFDVQKWNFDLFFKNRQFRKAGKVLKQVSSTPQYKYLEKWDKASWRIREAYLYFAFYTKNDEESIILYTPFFCENYKLQKFIDECHAISKDYHGNEILFLIVKLLLLMINGNANIIKEGKSMLSFSNRHLKDLDLDRTKTFFTSLSKAAEGGFQIDDLKKRSIEYKEAVSEDDEILYDHIELIQYETLWEMIIQLSKRLNK